VKSLPLIARPLGKMERSVWFCDQSSPTNIGLGCEVHGEVTDDALRSALRWCQIRHPILRSVILHEHKTLCLACYEISDAPEIPLEICVGTREEEDEIAMEEMRKPLASTQGLMARAKLLRLGEGASFLSIVFSHVVGDGFSAVLLLQDIVNFLGKQAKEGSVLDPDPLPFPPPSEHGIAADHRGWKGVKKFFAFQKEVAGRVRGYGNPPSAVRTQANPPFSDRKIKCLNFSLTKDETSALVARAKQEKVSLYALLSALLVDALHPFLEATKKNTGGERVVSFAAPVDMRPFLSSAVKEHFGFYSSALNHLCLVREKNDIPELARHLHTDLKKSFMQKKIHLYTTPVLAAFFSWSWLFPATDKGVARIAKITEGLFKSCAASMTFLNDSITIDEGHGMTISRPRGHISPSIMGAALYCVLFYKNILSVHLNYNEGQLSDADAEWLNQRFKDSALAMGQGADKILTQKE
jgi:Condensation domain